MPSRTTFQVKLQSADGAVFEVPPQIYKSFKTITSMIEANTIVDVVLVPNVNASSLCKVLRWTEYHMDDSLEENNGYPPEICEWDRELLRVEKNMLIELVLAANYLCIQRLLDVLSLVVLDLINNQSPEIVEDSSSYSASTTMALIKLQSDDGHVFEVPPQIYKCFKTINLMVEDPFKAKTIEEVLLVPYVNANSLHSSVAVGRVPHG
nr:S-phase kinase-associated protein 1-like [Aedes albopictus]